MIRLRLTRSLAAFALRLDLTLPGQGVTALFGASGSGKTTLLRCLAGLDRAGAGLVSFGDTIWQDDARGIFVPAHARGVGYVFQEPTLFAHRDVRGNLAFGYERTPKAQRRIAWEQAIELLGIADLLERSVAALSGGERQRVAIARALLASPRLLLMDEPLAALDASRRREILPLLQRLQHALELPILYVSHQMDEVVQLAEHLVMLDQGTVVVAGPLDEVCARADAPLTQEEEAGVVVRAVAAERDERHGLNELHFSGGRLFVAGAAVPRGSSVRLRIAARDVSLSRLEPRETSVLNRLPVTITQIAAARNPAYVHVRVDAGGTPLLARITLRSSEELQLQPGLALWAQVKSVALLH